MIESLLRTLISLSAVISGAIATYSSALAASENSTTEPSSVNVSAIAEADEYLDDVTAALQAADKATNQVKEKTYFQAALTAMNDANDVIEEAKLSADADAIDDFTDAIEAAQAAENEKEEQKYIDAALSAIDDIKAALERASTGRRK